MDDVDKILERGNVSIAIRKDVVDLIQRKTRRVKAYFLFRNSDYLALKPEAREHYYQSKKHAQMHSLAKQLTDEIEYTKTVEHGDTVYRMEFDYYKD